jgi:hypothetical protein
MACDACICRLRSPSSALSALTRSPASEPRRLSAPTLAGVREEGVALRGVKHALEQRILGQGRQRTAQAQLAGPRRILVDACLEDVVRLGLRAERVC